ncbi:MAG: Do family serine endopeptidase [Rhizobiales bacterium]|nr:Do family serine endopeptidase [Hyphomicrobiales bacterium]MBO6698005.1 Do family serine endopeptidase [Hyphomicrobiales bacterium]MBO6735741.1 Do family serine endopeptidase [Hyphomicrobiales bacterium]MBO6910451.1 Do family serine endopeptidase [Hyphomicrobiales bacterium]
MAAWFGFVLQAQAQNDLPERLLDLFINNAPILLEELNEDQAGEPTQLTREAPQNLAQVQLSFAPVVQLAAPAVVNVYATRTEQVRDPFANMDPFFRRFFGDQMRPRPRERMASSLGSGVIVDASGLIVTNNHVIEQATDVRVSLSDRREFAADILIRDERTDLAVLQVRDLDEPLPALSIGASDDLDVGDVVLAIGNPFGVGQTVTQGIVSALARTQVGVTDFQFFIQTDAAINPGNSGGALVDLSGRLVGINTAIFSRSGGSNGIGFAIPTEMVNVVLGEAASGASFVARPYLGAEVQAVTPAIAQSLGMRRPRGVLVADLVRGGPADQAGLRRGDVVVSIDGVQIEDPDAFAYRFATKGIGGTTSVRVIRDGRRRDLTIFLVGPPETVPRDLRLIEGRSPFAGVEVINLSPAVAQEFGFDQTEGVMIVSVQPGSVANQVGFREGDMIMQVNDRRVGNTFDLEQIANLRSRSWQIVFERNGRIRSAMLRF